MKKRIISSIISVCIIVLVMPFSVLAEETTLILNRVYSVTDSETYVFTPGKTGAYEFCSYGGTDPFVELYDSDDNYLGSATESDEGNDISLYCALLAGETYYFEVSDWNDDYPFKVKICEAAKQDSLIEAMQVDDYVVYENNIPDYVAPTIHLQTKDGPVEGNCYTVAEQMEEEYGREFKISLTTMPIPMESHAGTYKAAFAFDGICVQYNIIVKKNIVQSIRADDLILYENHIPSYFNPVLHVQTPDGTLSGGIQDIFTTLREKYGSSFNYPSGQSTTIPTDSKAGTYHASVTFGGLTADYNVIVEQDFIKSISAEDVNVVEGSATTQYDEIEYDPITGESYYEKPWLYYEAFPYRITVGTTKGSFTGTWSEVQEYLRNTYNVYCFISWDFGQSYDNQWEVGKTYKSSVKLDQWSAEYNVSVIANPCESVTGDDVVRYYDLGWHKGITSELIPPNITIKTQAGVFFGNFKKVAEDLYKTYAINLENGFNITPPLNLVDYTIGEHEMMARVCGRELKYYVNIVGRGELPVHQVTKHKLVAATCTTDGNSEYWVDEETGAIYADEAGTKPLSGTPVIKALGHSWDSGTVTKAATTASDGVMTFTCTRCNETKTEVIPKLKEETKPSGNVSTAKKANTLKVKVAKKTFKRSGLKKAKSFKIGVTKARGKVTYTLDKKAKKAKIKVSKKGKVTIPKNCKKGIYKITVKAAGNGTYKVGKKVVKIIIK